MDFSPNEEQVMLRNMARQFATHTIEPTAIDDDHKERLAEEILKQMASLGLLGAMVPQEYGGSGLDNIGYAILTEEIAHASLSIAISIFGSHALVTEALTNWGNEAQKKEYLPALCRGEMLGCYALGESGLEMNVAKIGTKVQFSDNQLVVNGKKVFVINGGIARLALVFAKGDNQGLSALLVNRDATGFSSEEIAGKSGLRAANIANIHLRDCRVPRENLLGTIDGGSRIARTLLDRLHFCLAAGCVGVAQACIDASIKYAQERQAFGKPLSNFGMIQDLIADMIVGTETARLMTYQVGDLKNKRQPYGRELAMARYLAASVALRAVRDAIQVHGAYGYEKRSPVERYFRDIAMATLYGGSMLTHKLAAARLSLGVT